jgi:hypothetical protein
MYYIFEWHYKEFHLRGVLYHIVVIGKGDRATVERALITRRMIAAVTELQRQPSDGKLDCNR